MQWSLTPSVIWYLAISPVKCLSVHNMYCTCSMTVQLCNVQTALYCIDIDTSIYYLQFRKIHASPTVQHLHYMLTLVLLYMKIVATMSDTTVLQINTVPLYTAHSMERSHWLSMCCGVGGSNVSIKTTSCYHFIIANHPKNKHNQQYFTFYQ